MLGAVREGEGEAMFMRWVLVFALWVSLVFPTEGFKLYRDQYNPELNLADSIVEDLLAVGTFRLKEKPKTALTVQSVRDWSLAEKAKR